MNQKLLSEGIAHKKQMLICSILMLLTSILFFIFDDSNDLTISCFLFIGGIIFAILYVDMVLKIKHLKKILKKYEDEI